MQKQKFFTLQLAGPFMLGPHLFSFFHLVILCITHYILNVYTTSCLYKLFHCIYGESQGCIPCTSPLHARLIGLLVYKINVLSFKVVKYKVSTQQRKKQKDNRQHKKVTKPNLQKKKQKNPNLGNARMHYSVKCIGWS